VQNQRKPIRAKGAVALAVRGDCRNSGERIIENWPKQRREPNIRAPSLKPAQHPPAAPMATSSTPASDDQIN